MWSLAGHAVLLLFNTDASVYSSTEGGACGQSMEEREGVIAELETIFRATGYPFHIVHLEQVFDLPISVLEAVSSAPQRPEGSYKAVVEQFIQNARVKGSCSPGEGHMDPAVLDAQIQLSHLDTQDLANGTPPPSLQHQQDLERLFASVRTLTAKEDMLQTLRQHLIVHMARTKGYTKVMMGDSCSRLAVKLLSNISLGRGASLAVDTGFSDQRYGDVIIVRPMRDYSSKEIAFYNRMFGVPSIFIPGLDTKAPEKASIQHLTESFVTMLQADFPSTVSTIYRTSEKLHTAHPPHSSEMETVAKCLLCLCALDTKEEEASAFHATLVSERLSEKRVPESAQVGSASTADTVGQCCSSGVGQEGSCSGRGQGCCSSNPTPVTPDLKSLLCYSCRLTIKDMTAVESLPPYIVSEAERRHRRSQMKKEISEFLLDDEEDEVAAS
ncbi:hypothetical protein JZ751_020907 [Albula glossodonta]|uniref:Cytoplasmic tRNA 2-thiolation protein 2 n=1 Tax=Albula glossodonta TaxID=121402 RepID=A0A8T2PGN8_9TELE|nr:hypothetical protein JZ751_020907 [Albula glossodonta]